MSAGEIRFNLMTTVLGVSLGLIMLVFDGGADSFPHFLLKFGFCLPALLLNVDMWVQFGRYHVDKESYGHKELFMDISLIALTYLALSTLKVAPSGSDAAALRAYPPRLFWIAMVLYALLKTYRAWPMLVPGHQGKGRMSWASLVHVLLLVLVVGGWGWQQDFPAKTPVPFEWSGLVFTVVAVVYLWLVYKVRWDPLTPLGENRKWSG